MWAKTDKYGKVIAEAETSNELARLLGVAGSTVRCGSVSVNSCYWKVDDQYYNAWKKLTLREKEEWDGGPIEEFTPTRVEPKPDKADYCDRCSERMEMGAFSRVSYDRDHWPLKYYRLCKQCTIQLRLFLEGDI